MIRIINNQQIQEHAQSGKYFKKIMVKVQRIGSNSKKFSEHLAESRWISTDFSRNPKNNETKLQ